MYGTVYGTGEQGTEQGVALGVWERLKSCRMWVASVT